MCDYSGHDPIVLTPKQWRNPKDEQGKELSDQLIVCITFACISFVMLIATIVVFVKGPLKGTSKYSKWFLLSALIVTIAISVGFGISSALQVNDNPMVLLYSISEMIGRINQGKLGPVIDPHHESFVAVDAVTDLEKSYEAIKHEIVANILPHRNEIQLTRDSYGGQNRNIGRDVNDGDGWRQLTINVGKRFADNMEEMCPTLVDILKKHSEDIISCTISILPGRTTIPPHFGYTRSVIRLMLPIVVPRGDVHICVNSNKLNFTEGKCLSFDDNFQHFVNNNTDDDRIVIYMDVVRPVPGLIRTISKYIFKKMEKHGIIKEEIKKTETLKKI